MVSTFMMFAGIYGFFTRRNLLAMLISVELILNSVDINFAVFNRYLFPEELEGFFDITPEDVDEAVPRTRRTVNREKVTDHHAILPTRSMLQADLEALPKGEQNVLKLIIARTLMASASPSGIWKPC